METKTVVPVGMLYSQGREYFLLHPKPIPGDSWEGDNAYRWVVVPRSRYLGVGNNFRSPYPHARHIVTNAFVVDYTQLPPIQIRVLEEDDLATILNPLSPEDEFVQDCMTREEWINYELAEGDNER